MISIARRTICLLMLMSGTHSPSVWGALAESGSNSRIPMVRAISFADQAVNLPQDLKGKAGVLVVGFTQGSRDALTAWGKRLAVDYYDASEVAYYEMPVLAGVPRLMRGFVIGRIKSSVSDRGKRHFVPILENEAAWKSTTQYQSGDGAYVLVVDSEGRVRWQTHAPFSEGIYAAMKGQVEELRSNGVRAVSGQAAR